MFKNNTQRNIYKEYRLLDCPELGYLTTDKPHPRGELAVRTKFMSSGYYNDEGATKEGFTEGIFISLSLIS